MVRIVRFGSDSSIQIESNLEGFFCEYGRPQQKPLRDCPQAVRDALAAPLGYPPLADITTADDRIVVAVGMPVPRGAEIVAEIICALTDSGVNPEGITVLQASQSQDSDICRLIPDDVRQKVRSVSHEPSSRDSMAYLATTAAGEPVMFNRILTDADLVIPVGCVRDATSSDYYSVNSTFFPAFSDEATQSRFRAGEHDKDTKAKLIEEVDEVGWLLGVSFSIQAIPGSSNELLHVVAGELDTLRDHACRLFDEAWRQTALKPARLVLATIEGGREQQTWENLGRAVANACKLVEEDGAIVVFCELDEEPGSAIRLLSQASSRVEALHEIDKEQLHDARPATQIAAALDRNHIYLMSKLDDALVEDLEITPLASQEELNRLIAHIADGAESCIILSNAAHAIVGIASE